MKKAKLLLVMLLILTTMVMIFTGCRAEDAKDAVEEPPVTEGDVVEEPFATLVDQMGREVIIFQLPEKIISLAPSNTEIAFALGLGERIVGITEFCNYPLATEGKKKVGGFDGPNMELIIELEPGLVLASSLHKEPVEQLVALGIPVLVIVPESLASVYAAMELIAEAAGVPEKAVEVIDGMQAELAYIQEKLADLSEEEKVRVYYEVWNDPLMSVGTTSFIHEIITLAGGINIFADITDNFPTVSGEIIAERNPQVILYPFFHGAIELTAELLSERRGWGRISAIEDDRIYGVNADIFSRPGPRLIQAIREAAEFFHPEHF